MKLSQIKANPNNPRLIKDERFAKLCKSIQDAPKFMALRPIIIDGEGMILGGNMRYKALLHLGYKEVPDAWVKRADELTEDEKKRFIIADNVGFGDWDYEALANEWDAEQLSDWGLDVPDFEVVPTEAKEDNYEIPETLSTDIVLGDLFEIGPHRLLCGDSTQTDTFEKLFEDKMADMVVTDPPYNVNYEGGNGLKILNDSMSDSAFYQFLYDFYTALGSFTKAGGAWYVWHADSEGANFRSAMKNAGVVVKQCLIWVKNSLVMGSQDYQWKHESCLYGWKEGASHNWYSDRKQTTVLEFDRPQKNTEHPTMKPVPLISYQICNSSKQGDIVADAFGGSGTTMVAAHQLNRIAYLVEYDPKYCQVIIDRMLKLDPTLEIKRNGQPYKKTGV
jgi:site-specific DNA-methyltransferase (adenine-specific)